MRPFDVLSVTQRSPEWRRCRAGRLCASDAKDMLATIKSGEAAARRDLRLRLVVERLTGQPQDDVYVNGDMQRGIELEADARLAYEVLTGRVVTEVGFLAHRELPAGYSPDGVVGQFERLVEIKVPRSATHLRYLEAAPADIPTEHKAQLTHALWLTGVEAIDFFSFDPRFPDGLQTYLRTVTRADLSIDAFDRSIRAFLTEVDAELQQVQALTKKEQAA